MSSHGRVRRGFLMLPPATFPSPSCHPQASERGISNGSVGRVVLDHPEQGGFYLCHAGKCYTAGLGPHADDHTSISFVSMLAPLLQSPALLAHSSATAPPAVLPLRVQHRLSQSSIS